MVAPGLVSDSAATTATFWLRLSECDLFTDSFSGWMPDLRMYQRAGCFLYPVSMYGGGICAAGVQISQAVVGEIIDPAVSRKKPFC
jgi:hypothetical protein